MNSVKSAVITEEQPRLVAIGGGSGLATLLEGLRQAAPDADITGVVTVTDDGGSTGRLMEQYGTQPVGDLRRGLSALVDDHRVARRLEHRMGERDTVETVRAIGRGLLGILRKNGHLHDEEFASYITARAEEIAAEQSDELRGHTYGNLLLTAAAVDLGSLRDASGTVGTMVRARGRVLPVSSVPHRLVLRDGAKTYIGERVIDDLPVVDNPLTAELVFTTDPDATPEDPRITPVPADREVLDAVGSAHLIELGLGSRLTSVLPPLKAGGMAEAIAKAGKVIVTPNLTVNPDSAGMTVGDYVWSIQKEIGPIDAVIFNNDLATLKRLGVEPVIHNPGELDDMPNRSGRGTVDVYGIDLARTVKRKPNKNDALAAIRSEVLTRGEKIGETALKIVVSSPALNRELAVAN
jgi:2-phospho-L-lactate transferase/gluconeogenesis factor (CofD/UPF0052 family)